MPLHILTSVSVAKLHAKIRNYSKCAEPSHSPGFLSPEISAYHSRETLQDQHDRLVERFNRANSRNSEEKRQDRFLRSTATIPNRLSPQSTV